MSSLGTPTSTIRRIILSSRPSVRSRLLWWIVKLFLSLLVGDPPEPRKGQQIWTLPPKRIQRAVRSGRIAFSEWEEPKSGWKIPKLQTVDKSSTGGTAKRAMLYFHGSGFTQPIGGTHWEFMAWLSGKLDAEVYAVPYPLSPKNTIHEYLPRLIDMYGAFVEKSRDQEIILAGDSAGAVLSLCLTFAVHEAGLPLPRHIIAISPAANLDLYKFDAEMRAIQPFDPMLDIDNLRKARRKWLGLPIEPNDPLPEEFLRQAKFNPSMGDLSALKEAGTQLIIASGTYDIVHPYAEDYANLAEKAGVNTVYIEGQRQVHVFPILRKGIPEAAVAADAIVDAILTYKS